MNIALRTVGRNSFNLGIFLLPSAPAISGIFIIISIIISSIKRKDKYFKDKWNYPFVISSLLMIISCFLAEVKGYNLKLNDSESLISWISLFHWIPLFFCFWALQPYLLEKEDRKKTALLFICGCIPVVITGFGQYWFQWHGPFELAINQIKLVVWYQREVGIKQGLTGLFNNANYAGALLTMALPFCLSAIYQKNQSFLNRIIVVSINIMVITAIVLTNSRSAWIGLFICIPLLFGSIRLLIKTISTLSFLLISITLFDWVKVFLLSIFPVVWVDNFDLNLIASDARVKIFGNALRYISERPFFGVGGSGFAGIEKLSTKCSGPDYCYQHAHNLPLELAVNYGLITSIIVSCSVIVLLYYGYNKIAQKEYIEKTLNSNILFERAWIVSATITLSSHLVDIQYFDGRISLFSWILLAGIRSIIMNKKITKIMY